MSANTYWRPATKGHSVDCLSSFLDVVADALDCGAMHGELGLTAEALPALRGIAAADKNYGDWRDHKPTAGRD